TAPVFCQGRGWRDGYCSRDAAPNAQGLAGRDQPCDVVRRRRVGMRGKPPRDQRDLVVLVADKDMEQATRQLLQRPASLGISATTHEVYTHPDHDSGCRTASHDLLRSLASQYRFALVMFDHEGSGGDTIERAQLERQVEARLEANGWSGRCGA